ncbi:shikimate kinase, partial [Candidatus Poribacteria bacterium]|nr:shikimate kinase [Candidatus Poribacteria bacterium]
IIYNRVKNFAHRPLFQASDPVKNIKSLLFKRQPFYQKAKDFEIDTTNLSPEKIVEAIEAKLLSLKF